MRGWAAVNRKLSQQPPVPGPRQTRASLCGASGSLPLAYLELVSSEPGVRTSFPEGREKAKTSHSPKMGYGLKEDSRPVLPRVVATSHMCVAVELLKHGQSELSCADSVKHTLAFKD